MAGRGYKGVCNINAARENEQIIINHLICNGPSTSADIFKLNPYIYVEQELINKACKRLAARGLIAGKRLLSRGRPTEWIIN